MIFLYFWITGVEEIVSTEKSIPIGFFFKLVGNLKAEGHAGLTDYKLFNIDHAVNKLSTNTNLLKQCGIL